MNSMINFTTGIVLTLVPIYLFCYTKEKGFDKKQALLSSVGWGLLAFLLALIVLPLTKQKAMFNVLIPTSIGSSILGFFLLNGQCDLKKIPKSVAVFLGFFFSSLLQLIPIFFFRMDLEHLSKLENSLLPLFSNSMFVAILLTTYWQDLKKAWVDFRKHMNQYFDEGFKYWLLGLGVMMISNLAINFFFPQSVAANEESVQNMIHATPIITFISVVFLAPVIEELVFRKAFKDVFRTKWAFILTSGIVFGGLHVVLSLHSWQDLLYLIPYSSLGIAFASAYQKTDNIFTTISMHLLHNGILTSLSLLTALVVR